MKLTYGKLFLVLLTTNVMAKAETYVFQSPYDRFELIVTPQTSLVDNKPANINSIKDILPLLKSIPANECGTITQIKPTLTIKIGSQTRAVYLKEGVISDGKACLNVAGEGLFYLPLHRDFLIGSNKGTITLQSSLKLFQQGKKVFEIKKMGKEWQNEMPEVLPNWDFFERFINSLASYTILNRIQTEITNGKPKILLSNGTENLELYKINPTLWAIKKPGMKWLESSNDWSFWYDFGIDVIQDHLTDRIQLIGNSANEKSARLSAIEQVSHTWSKNLRDLFHKLVTSSDDEEIQAAAIKRLKHKPSAPTARVMVQILQSSSSEELKKEAGNILKLQYPKGPAYKPTDSQAQKQKVIDFWRDWWTSQENG